MDLQLVKRLLRTARWTQLTWGELKRKMSDEEDIHKIKMRDRKLGRKLKVKFTDEE